MKSHVWLNLRHHRPNQHGRGYVIPPNIVEDMLSLSNLSILSRAILNQPNIVKFIIESVIASPILQKVDTFPQIAKNPTPR